MEFDIRHSRVSRRAFGYAIFALVLVVALLASGGSYSKARTTVVAVFALLLTAAVMGSLYELFLRLDRRSSDRRLRKAVTARPDTLYVGYAQTSGFVLAGNVRTFGSGLITLGRHGLTYVSGREVTFPAPLEIAWTDVDSVALRPTVEFRGKLQLRLRDGKTLSWWLRGDCDRAVEALADIRDSR